MDVKDLKQDIETLGKAWEEFKSTNDTRLAKLEKGEALSDLDHKLEKIGASMDDVQSKQEAAITERKALEEKVKDLEAELELGLTVDGTRRKSRAEIEYEAKFDKWLRACREDSNPPAEVEAERKAAYKALMEEKAISGATDAEGGAAIPDELFRQIADQVRLLSPFRDLVTVRTIGSRNYEEVLNIHGENSGWVAETGTRNESNTPTFRVITPTLGTLYAYPRATEEALDDTFFDVGSFLADTTATEFAIAEGQAILDGNGTARPTGILNTTPVTTDDDASPPRAAAAIEYVPLDNASPAAGIEADELITLFYTLRAPYRQNATWTMNSVVMAAVRKLKGSDNNYLWQPGLQMGAPSVLLGRPVRIMENMAGLTQLAFPILVGDFRRGYILVERSGMRITVDDNLTTPGYVKWYIRRREGGIILDNNAIKAGRYSGA